MSVPGRGFNAHGKAWEGLTAACGGTEPGEIADDLVQSPAEFFENLTAVKRLATRLGSPPTVLSEGCTVAVGGGTVAITGGGCLAARDIAATCSACWRQICA